MFRSCFSRRLRRPTTRKPRTALTVERLEARCVPATFTVTSLADSGTGSLRQAITDANMTPGDDVIRFQGAGTIGAIDLLSPLPALSTNINLQGPGAARLSVRRSPSAVGVFP